MNARIAIDTALCGVVANLEEALDRERRALMRADEARLARYRAAAGSWAEVWPSVAREIAGRSLLDAHQIVVERAGGILPFTLPEEAT